MKIFNNIKLHFRKKTPEQVFSFCLFIGCFSLMLFCAIVRLCGGLWFSADLSYIKEPSPFWQEIIMACLLIFELLFVYKILCRTKWIWCFLISIAQVILLYFSKSALIDNIINLVLYFAIPFVFKRKWGVLLESAFMYIVCTLYASLFLLARIGSVNVNYQFNFVYNVLGCIDYKLFIVSIYLYIKNFGGIKLWKTKILI